MRLARLPAHIDIREKVKTIETSNLRDEATAGLNFIALQRGGVRTVVQSLFGDGRKGLEPLRAMLVIIIYQLFSRMVSPRTTSSGRGGGTRSLATFALLFSSATRNAIAKPCLDLDSELSYAQHETPADLRPDLTALIIDIENGEAVRDVRVTWPGSALSSSVGSYQLVAHASVAGRSVCYTMNILVTDTDECDEKTPLVWRHRCDVSMLCVNTIGSYRCEAQPRDAPLGVCKTLPMQTFAQHEAPTDVTGDVTEVINAESDEPIEDVQLTWLGSAVHASVGVFDIVANVTLEGGRGTRCYTRRIEVTDTNECDGRTPLNWRHRCDISARCVNIIGSYMCTCDRDLFAPRDAPHGSVSQALRYSCGCF